MSQTKMQCPMCGAAMNKHAEKIDNAASWREPTSLDSPLGGVVMEFHKCPKCGASASRRGE